MRLVRHLAFLALVAGLTCALAAQTPPPAGLVTVDVRVVDRTGRTVDDLAASDFSVTVGGAVRRVDAVRFVARGPGAVAEARDRAGVLGTRSVASASEPARQIVIVLDQLTMARGEERSVAKAVTGFLGRLGLDDQIAIVPLPLDGQPSVGFGRDRPAVQEALRRVAGRACLARSKAGPPRVIPNVPSPSSANVRPLPR